MGRIMVGVVFLGAILSGPTAGVGQLADTITVTKGVVTALQQQWLAATPQERVRLAEAIGDDGARAMAKAKGYETLFDGFGRLLPQGPDQVYRAAGDRVVVVEAKGGSAQLGRAYGHPQGTPEWAVESAKRVLRSAKASEAERKATREILQAAANGKLEVHVVRTRHVLGEPTAAVLEKITATSDDAARLARVALAHAAPAVVSVTDDAARGAAVVAAKTGKSTAMTVAKVAVPVVVVVDAAMRTNDAIEIERQFDAAEITAEEREVKHARNAAGTVGGWGGAAAGAKGGALAGGAVAGPWGAAGGAIAGGVAGYVGGEAAAEAAAEWAVTSVHEAGTTVAEAASSAWSATSDAAATANDAISSAWSWATDW